MTSAKQLKICSKGHRFYKSSDCPTCPVCENERKPEKGFLSLLSAPARRALEGRDITTLQKLAKHSEKEILDLHGIGKTTIPILRNALASEGLTFRK
jgi:predicted RecB family nuclease